MSLSRKVIDDPAHHLTGPFLPQTPLGSGFSTPDRSLSPPARAAPRSIFLRWVLEPAASFKLLLLPLVLYVNWELMAPYLNPDLANPFANIFLLSGRVPHSPPTDPRYQKSYWDLAFLAYYVVFFSCARQSLLIYVSRPAARYFGLKRPAKISRFGEQAYALVYHMTVGIWGYYIMSLLPIYFYNTPEFWKGYPHWDMKPQLKCYYLIQFSYWLQQLLVLAARLEKPRSDYVELICHHIVTIWLIGWSYFTNMTLIGVAVYISMDLPDGFLAFSKLLNYIQWNTAKIYSVIVFFGVWTYFRHYLNFKILWSVWSELPIYAPDFAKKWSFEDGVYLPEWMRYQVFLPLLLLQFLNLLWYYLIVKVLIRAITAAEADDDRSDDEDEDTAQIKKE